MKTYKEHYLYLVKEIGYSHENAKQLCNWLVYYGLLLKKEVKRNEKQSNIRW